MRKKFKIVCTTFDKKGNILSKARNMYNKTHPLMKYFSEKAGEPERISLHAEVYALIKAKKEVHSILVERYMQDGSPALGAPCACCREAIKAFGVKKVRYTTESGIKEVNVMF